MMARRMYLSNLPMDRRIGLYVYERCDQKGNVSRREKLQTKELLRWSRSSRGCYVRLSSGGSMSS